MKRKLPPPDPPERIYTLGEVAQMTNLPKSTIKRLVVGKRFPQQTLVGRERVGWSESSVKAWLAKLPSGQ
jgi:predicted DNA-binding transcriptional regulator AlpA